MRRSAIPTRTDVQVALMRRAGRVVAQMHEACARAAVPGATTADLDRVAREVLARAGATSNFLGYHGFPGVICTSINDVVVHGIPSDDDVLSEGDLLSLDCGAIVDGWHADAAITIPIGEVDDAAHHLLNTARTALLAAIATLRDGVSLGEIGAAIEKTVAEQGLAVVADYSGHGIGRALHEAPEVANVAHGADRKVRLRAGNTVAIEPIVVTGDPGTEVAADEWTVFTLDGGRAAHFEHSVLVTSHGAEVLTLPWGPR